MNRFTAITAALLTLCSPAFAMSPADRCLIGNVPAKWLRDGGYCSVILNLSSLTSGSTSYGGVNMGGGAGPKYLNLYGSGLIGKYTGTAEWNGKTYDVYHDINGKGVDHLIAQD